VNLYLDVDGVVNVPFHRGTAGFSDWEDTGFVTWSPAMVGRLGALEVDSHWLTTWRDEANTVLAPLFGWEPLGVLARAREHMWWKLEALWLTQDHAQPFVWIDDELDERRRESQGMLDVILERFAEPFLLISPVAHVGLSPSELTQIEHFVGMYG
jgi:hypothetical protein